VTPDLYGAWLTAGNNLQPYIGWAVGHWIDLAIGASFLVLGLRILRWALRHRIPAAPDNVPPTDDDLLITCRRIHRLPHIHPEISRAAYRHLRQKGDQQ
jgi:hypothetical protein